MVALIVSLLIKSPETIVLVGFLLLSFLPLFLRQRLNNFYDFLFIVIIIFNTSSFIWDAYGMVHYYDDIVHFVTPFLIVVLSGQFFIRYFREPRKNLLVLFLVLSSFGILLGTSWEIIEWISENTFLPYSVMFGLPDTMSDLSIDLIGSLLGALTYIYLLSKNELSLIAEEIAKVQGKTLPFE